MAMNHENREKSSHIASQQRHGGIKDHHVTEVTMHRWTAGYHDTLSSPFRTLYPQEPSRDVTPFVRMGECLLFATAHTITCNPV
jgi:hypothetical protein